MLKVNETEGTGNIDLSGSHYLAEFSVSQEGSLSISQETTYSLIGTSHTEAKEVIVDVLCFAMTK
jgi:hypothetical protein